MLNQIIFSPGLLIALAKGFGPFLFHEIGPQAHSLQVMMSVVIKMFVPQSTTQTKRTGDFWLKSVSLILENQERLLFYVLMCFFAFSKLTSFCNLANQRIVHNWGVSSVRARGCWHYR